MKNMIKRSSKDKRSVIISDEYLSESGIQGGNVLGEHIALFSFIIGIPLLLIGIYGLINMLFGWGFPTNTAIIILVIFVIINGLFMTRGGYTIYRDKKAMRCSIRLIF